MATDPENDALEFRFDFGDGTPRTSWSSDSSANHTYSEAGRYLAKVHVRDEGSLVSISVLTVTVTEETKSPPPARSTEVVCDEARRTVWTVNPDHGTVAAFDIDSLGKRFETAVGEEPRSLAVDLEGRA